MAERAGADDGAIEVRAEMPTSRSGLSIRFLPPSFLAAYVPCSPRPALGPPGAAHDGASLTWASGCQGMPGRLSDHKVAYMGPIATDRSVG
jgi:hypothetical protein